MQLTNKEYKDGFYDELNAFKGRVKKRAAEKIEAAMKEAEEEERQKRIGPGGLDPVEVFENLPDELKSVLKTKTLNSYKV
jgi:cell division cycle protein 37